MATGEDAAAVEDRSPPAAADRRATKPVTRPTLVAGRLFDLHGVLSVLPYSATTAMPVSQDHAVILDLHLNPRHEFAVAPTLPVAPVARPQYSFARAAPHIQGAVIFRRGLRSEPRAVPATRACPLDFPVINWLTDLPVMFPNPL